MTVCLAIISILLATVVFGQANFNRTLILTDTAYTIALSVRQMQSYGVSSHYFNSGSTVYNNAGFGVHFDKSLPQKYYQFADISGTLPVSVLWCPTTVSGSPSGAPDSKPGNCLYDGSNEQLRSFSLNSGYTITNICGYPVGGSALICSSSYPSATLDATYLRPNTQTILTGDFGSTYYQFSYACVQLTAPSGDTTKWVELTQLGEVLVTNTCS